jgi:5-methylcytosine-specific restriction endonuclease McrA
MSRGQVRRHGPTGQEGGRRLMSQYRPRRPKTFMRHVRWVIERYGLQSEGKIQNFCHYCRTPAIAEWIPRDKVLARFPWIGRTVLASMGPAYIKVPFELDHVVPVAKGGAHKLENFVLACQPCNSKKKALSVEQFLAKYKVDPLRDYDEKVA